jgi:hypothetical protein
MYAAAERTSDNQGQSIANAVSPKRRGLSAARSQRPVTQRYTEQGGYKVSDGRRLAIASGADRPHEYFSTHEQFEASAAKLTELDSPVVLIEGAANGALAEFGTLRSITAGKKDAPLAPHPLQQVECIDVATEILRAPDSTKWKARLAGGQFRFNPSQIASIQTLIHPIVTATTGAIRSPEKFGQYVAEANETRDTSTVVTATGQNFLASIRALEAAKFPAVLKRAIREYFDGIEMPVHKMMLFLDYLRETGEDGQYAEADEDAADTIIRNLLQRVETTYSMAFAHDSRHPATAAGYGINQGAIARLGEALSILSTGPRQPGSDKWNYHFAAVIATDAADVVTMENETNREVDRVGNWAFKMYGTRVGQSFHEIHAHGAENPLTVAVAPNRD